jgi:hypothetical protein
MDLIVGIIAGVISGVIVWITTRIYSNKVEKRRWLIDYMDRYSRYLSRIVDELVIYKDNRKNYDIITRLIADEPNRPSDVKITIADEDLYNRCRILLHKIKFPLSYQDDYPTNPQIDEWMEELIGYSARAWQIR